MKALPFALIAVALWSSTPLLVHNSGSSDPLITYLASSLIAFLASTFILRITSWSRMMVVFTDSIFAASSIASGSLLAVWYCCFYASLQGPSVALASSIAFTWPSLSFFSMRWLRHRRLWIQPMEAICLAASIVGATIVSLGTHTHSSHTSTISLTESIVFAVFASIGSGLYLPFGAKALERYSELTHSGPLESTAISIWMSNGVSFIATSAYALLAHHVVNQNDINSKILVPCAIIGIGVYLVAEISWMMCKFMKHHISVSSLPLIVPVVSTILASVALDEHVSLMQIVGMLIVVGANISIGFASRNRT